jgi:soluble lytic murein transglycosylase
MPPAARLALLAALLPALAGPARAQDVMALVHADRWAEAAAAAAVEPDPVAAKLVTYYRLLAPYAATQAEIGQFMADSPDWPAQATLARRRDEALAVDQDDADAAQACAAGVPVSAAALGRCAAAATALGQASAAAGYARRAWVALPANAVDEGAFLQQWGAVLGPPDELARFDRIAWTDTDGAARQATRLSAADQPAAAARLSLRRDEPGALALFEALPAAAQATPALMLEDVRYLRRAGRDADALALWLARGTPAEQAAPPERRTLFWDERNILARHRLRDGDPQGAYALAAGHAQTAGEAVADAEFLAGFIALRKLNNPALAIPHFQRLATASHAAITQGRAHYWLARATADPVAARREYATAAAWPSTFYGQLASLALGEGTAGLARRITDAHDPGWDSTQALDFAGRELARAAAWLVAWGESHRAQAFLLRLVDVTRDPADRSMAAHLAAGFGLPETEIAVARRAGVAGQVLLDAGWPLAADIPADAGLEPALALGIIRQESSFDTGTVSPAGARGLMQLMPETARDVAKLIGMRTPLPSLTGDPAANIRLGSVYLHGLLDQYDGCAPLAIAAYNAGPNRVQQWLTDNGDPRTPGVAMLDWIEEIPFGETRNYVQRVIENEVVYRAKRGELTEHPLAKWLQ